MPTAIFWTDSGTDRIGGNRSADEAAKRAGWLLSELQAGRLRQGWGYDGCDLLIGIDRWIPKFKAGFDKSWPEKAPATVQQAHRRYAILSAMLKLEPGDQVVVPRMPATDRMTLVRVKHRYRFDPQRLPFPANNPVSHGHLIEVDTCGEVAYGSCPDAELLRSKFSKYQRAVSLIYESDHDTRDCIAQLFSWIQST